MRLTLAVLCLAVTAGISCLAGQGHGYSGTLILVAWFMLLSDATERQVDMVWRVLLWASILFAALAAVQLPWVERPTGPFGSPNYPGAFASVMVFVAWRAAANPATDRKNVLLSTAPPLVAVGANLLAVALTQSRGAILAVGAGAVALLWRQRPVLSGTIGLGALLGAVLLHRPEARLSVWELGLAAGLQRPLTGWGISGINHIASIDGRLMLVDHFYSVPLDW